jgi:hydroxypyruvate reductase
MTPPSPPPLPARRRRRAIDALELGRARRVWLFAIGKAARPMAAAAVRSLQRGMHSIIGGVVVSPDDGTAPYPTLVSLRGDHPTPGRLSFEAAVKIGEVAAGRRSTDIAIVLLSGGASALIGAPVRGIAESDFVLLHELLLGSGLDIAAMNSVRKRFSRWSAGRLALALAPAAIYCLAISDVADDDLSVIGSGPCVPDTTTAKDVRERLERAGLFDRVPQAMRDYLGGMAKGTTPETPTKSHPAFAHITGARHREQSRRARRYRGSRARARARGQSDAQPPRQARRPPPVKRSRERSSPAAPRARRAALSSGVVKRRSR